MLKKIKEFYEEIYFTSNHEHEFVFREVLSVSEIEDQGILYEKHRELLVCKCGQRTTLDVFVEKQ